MLKKTDPKSVESSKRIRIYIYDWPDELINCWPKRFSHHRLSYEEQFSNNSFFGPVVDGSNSLFHTHQYSVYQILLRKFISSSIVTRNPDEASHFLIPYDIGKCLI